MFPGIDMETNLNFLSLMMFVIAVVTWLAMFIQKYFFSLLSEKVTWRMREALYNEILCKNIGWFDLRENSVGILSSAMA